ncbi:MAG: hypothetical protein KJ938_05180 [Actinobacteria bacterium]|nr:hypothetical protein [Actinomycetota bacterium]
MVERPSGAARCEGVMELISVPVSAALLTGGRGVGGEFVVSHGESALTRGLEPDEHVVVVDPDGEFHAAQVVDIEFDLTDTHYVLELGVRLPPHVVRDRLLAAGDAAPAGTQTDGVDERDVLDLLRRLRDVAGDELRDDPWGGPGAPPR